MSSTLSISSSHYFPRTRLHESRLNGQGLLYQRAFKRKGMKHTIQSLFRSFPGVHIKGEVGLRVDAITTDSRRVTPGSIFFAIRGRRTDGHLFIEEAVDRGAVAIVSETAVWIPRNVVQIQATDLRRLVGLVANRFYGSPEKGLNLHGVAGTSGKTVVTSLLHDWLHHQPESVAGLLGTNQYHLGKRSLPAYRTTPEPIELYGLLSQMKEADCGSAFIEVSSHGLDQKRVAGLSWKTATFLNLTPEHLDYHGSLESVYKTTEEFFLKTPIETAVINLDDPYGKRLLAALPDSQARLTFGMDPQADFRVDGIEYQPDRTRFTLHHPEGLLRLVTHLLGEFNLQNILAALTVASTEGLSVERAAARLIEFEGVRGRMERIETGLPFNVIIDYAHTEASYAKALRMLRPLTANRILTVFGCGGNRDRTQRPRMTKTVVAGSDWTFATADNPRNETVEDIFDDMKEGVEAGSSIQFVIDRRLAIARALQMAAPGDTVFIAGKGHETFQEFGDCVVPFDDRSVVRDLLRTLKEERDS